MYLHMFVEKLFLVIFEANILIPFYLFLPIPRHFILEEVYLFIFYIPRQPIHT